MKKKTDLQLKTLETLRNQFKHYFSSTDKKPPAASPDPRQRMGNNQLSNGDSHIGPENDSEIATPRYRPTTTVSPSRRQPIPMVKLLYLTESAVQGIAERVQKNLEYYYSSEEKMYLPDRANRATQFDKAESAPDVSLIITDECEQAKASEIKHKSARLIISQTPSNPSLRGDFSLSSYDSDIFDPNQIFSENRMSDALPPGTSAEIIGNREIYYAIDREIVKMRRTVTATSADGTKQPRENSAPQFENIQSNQDRPLTKSLGIDADRLFALIEIIIEGIENLKNTYATTAQILARGNVGIALTDAASVEPYERDSHNRPQEIDNVGRNTENHARLREAKDHFPLFDGSNEEKLMEFLTTCNYAFEIIHPADEAALVRALICTKQKGNALVQMKNRDPRNYASLKKKLATALFTATTEGNEYSEHQKSTIHRYIKQQALINYQLGLNEKLQTIIRSRAPARLVDAIMEAVEEECVKGVGSINSRPNDIAMTTRYRRYANSMPAREPPTLKYLKCGKLGHTGRDCRSSRRGTQFPLPKSEGNARVNNVIKHCTFCDKSGHNRKECRNLHGRTTPAHATDTDKTRNPTPRTVQFREERISLARNTQSDEDSDRDEERRIADDANPPARIL
ncbi:hypothetical protein EAI_06204 [Harpegnathos saltator]|uniref:CCHC-type domain-containing protein n=1 Tax=Harpegnathos saltator TaxID=610380 RepID=E2B4T2_HARSA|nr:hypothetical protein EAI_06204 [Harpegnathos saltator]